MRRFLFFTPLLLAAAPGSDAVSVGNGHAVRGEFAAAESHFAAAATVSTDPGLVAYNRGCAAAAQGNFAGAAAWFTCAMDDAACPPGRLAAAAYNRGLCRLKLGEHAVADFRKALGSAHHDDAAYNLELAKLLAPKARAKPDPAANDPAGTQDPPPSPDRQPMELQPDPTQPGASRGTPQQTPGKAPAGQPSPMDQQAPGSGSLPVLAGGRAEPLSANQARSHLAAAAARSAKDRRAADRMLAGPERPHVRDW